MTETNTQPRPQGELPKHLIIRDAELIQKIERERALRADGTCTATAKKILTKYFAQQDSVLASAGS